MRQKTQSRLIQKYFICIMYILLLSSTPDAAHSEILAVANVTAVPGETIIVPITIDQPEKILGAAFTICFDSQYLTIVDIQSSFFETFANQWSSIVPAPNPTPPSNITVGGINYTQPLLYKQCSCGYMVAGVRAQYKAGVTTMFEIQFAVDTNIPEGIYSISITNSIISNTAAGYSDSGEWIPMLIGQGYDIYSYCNDGSITIQAVIEDSDGDGIPDAWEFFYFENLTIANQFSDFDKDRYTDIQEFLNQQNNELDPDGNPYNPKQINAPSGTGYIETTDISSILLLLLSDE
ncbi:MAG: cohesin domain-containing protein [Thermodesulfobacteriota bacterium]|nr:cohesin domain-containing protein [Thermodesulfobacteriota bacterium]